MYLFMQGVGSEWYNYIIKSKAAWRSKRHAAFDHKGDILMVYYQYKPCENCGEEFYETLHSRYSIPKQKLCALCETENLPDDLWAEQYNATAERVPVSPLSASEPVTYVKSDDPRYRVLRLSHFIPSARSSNYRAARYGLSGRILAEDILAIFVRQECRCAYCGERLIAEWHVDHIMPLSVGGKNDIGNIAIACAECNSSKGAKSLEVWQSYRRTRNVTSA